MKSKIITILLAVMMVISLTTTAPMTATSAANDVFKIIGVEVLNERIAIVYLNEEVSVHFEQMLLPRANYLPNYIRLDGEYLTNNREIQPQTAAAYSNNGSRMYLRDDRKSFELVLGNSTTTGAYAGPTFKASGTIQFDFDGKAFLPYYHMHETEGLNANKQSGDIWVRDINDIPMSQEVFAYTASALGEAPVLKVESIRILDSRAIYVKFNQRIIHSEQNNSQNSMRTAGLLTRAYLGNTAALLQITGGGTTLNSMYSYRLNADHPLSDGTAEGREFIIYFNGDIQPGTEYSYNWTNTGGHSPNFAGPVNRPAAGATAVQSGQNGNPAIAALATVPGSDFDLLKAELIESESGKFELELTFDRPFAYTRIANESRFRTINSNTSNNGAWSAKLYDVRDPVSGDIIAPVDNATYSAAWPYSIADVEANRTHYQPLVETSTGMTATVLTVNDVKEILTLYNVFAGDATTPYLDAFTGDTIIGYFKNSNTIVLNNNNRLPITLGTDATVAVKDQALVGYGTRGTWGSYNTSQSGGLSSYASGYMRSKTNGPRNTAIAPVAITKRAEKLGWADGYDPSWDKGVVVTDTIVKLGHNDVYYVQYDGIKDPLIGGFDPRVPHSINLSNTTIYAPDGRAFGNSYANNNPNNNSGSNTGTLELGYVVQTAYPAIELENKYIKATIVPGHTARFLKFIFKPTGHDVFYTNPAATNYNITGQSDLYPPTNIGGGTFVAGWLFVWGGTFPVFDGCEHGQAWMLPWDYELKDYPDGSKSVICKLKNDQNFQVVDGNFVPSSINASVGGKFTSFGTGLEYTIEYRVYPDSPVVDMGVSIHNPAQVARTYEYYTCNTFAPGEVSEWGHGTMKHVDATQIITPHSSEYTNAYAIVNREASNDKTEKDVRLYHSMNYTDEQAAVQLPQSVRNYVIGSNMSEVNLNIRGSHARNWFYEFDTNRYLANCISMGTQFANDLNRLPQADWSGAVTLKNLEGVMRSGPDLMKATPGIKYWIWDYGGMFDCVPFEWDSANQERPYLEPWASAGNKYFMNRAIDAGETHSWVESYYHSFGLDNVTNSNPDALALVKFYNESGAYRAAANFYSTKLEKTLTAVLRNMDNNSVIKTYTYTSRIMAHEEIEADSLVPAGSKVQFELYEGAAAIGTPFFTAWVVQGKAFEVDRETPVEKVIISHTGTNVGLTKNGEIDIPGRTTSSNRKYHVREIFAYAEPFWVDGHQRVTWSLQEGDAGDAVLISSATATDPAPINLPETSDLPGNSTFWHSFDYITLRGITPGKSVTFRATANDENIDPAGSVYADLKVNVKKPLYLTIQYNPGNSAGSTPGYALARNMYSPYKFNLDMNIPLTITKDDADNITGPINVEIWDRNNEAAAPYFTEVVSGLGTHILKIPANTLPREEYYKIVARTVNGDSLGYEFFRVDGYSQVVWSNMITQSGDNINIRFTKKNSNVSGSVTLASGEAQAYVNGVPYSVSVGTTTSGVASNANTLIITGGFTSVVNGENTIEVVGVEFPDYPGHTFTFTGVYVKQAV